MSEEKFPKDVAVALKTAEVWTKNHRDDVSIEDSKNKVNSYLIPRETLEMVLNLKTTAVRAYIGVNGKKQKTLIFVGAELEESTGIYRDVFGTNALGENSDSEEVVYDFAEPSPPFKGDDLSPLNQ